MELLFKCMAAVHMELRVRECVSLVGITDQGAWIALQFNFLTDPVLLQYPFKQGKE